MPHTTPAQPRTTLKTPKEVTAAVVHPASSDLLLTASEDHSLRLHDLATARPLCAIVGLPSEVAALVFARSEEEEKSNGEKEHEGGWGEVWLACGQNAHLVRLDRTPFLRPFNAAVLRTIELSSDEVNDLTLSKDGKVLGWCGDEGRLGVVNLDTGVKTWMKGKHTNIVGSISFLAGRSDLVSTGYDSTARLWSSATGSLLDTFHLTPPPPSSSPTAAPSMSPSFPVSLASTMDTVSGEPLICIGTADGGVWVSSSAAPPGESEKDRKKRLKGRWRGLQEGRIARAEVAMGPVVGVAFLPTQAAMPSLVTLTHLGTITVFGLSSKMAAGGKVELDLKPMRTWSTAAIRKCTAFTVVQSGDEGGSRVIVGGIDELGEGRIEVWDL